MLFLTKPFTPLIPGRRMSSIITAQRLGKFLIWIWLKYIRKTPVAYDELDFRYSDWMFIGIGCIFFAVVVGLTLLFFNL